MAEQNTEGQNTNPVTTDQGAQGTTGEGAKPSIDLNSPEIKAALQAAIDANLAEIKGKLDAAYKTRDDLAKKVQEREEADRKAHLEALEKEGKLKEAYELRLQDLDAKNKALADRNVRLTRDVEVRDALAGYSFRNDVAAEMARRTITDQLVQREDGTWTHKSGSGIRDFVKSFAESEEQAFLFKPKANQGAGTDQPSGGAPNSSSGKSLFDLPQSEVLAKVARGELGNIRRF